MRRSWKRNKEPNERACVQYGLDRKGIYPDFLNWRHERGAGAGKVEIKVAVLAELFPTVESLLRVRNDEDLFPAEDSLADKAPYGMAQKKITVLREDPEAHRLAR